MIFGSKREVEHLLEVIEQVHTQHADDLCWMDIDKIFVAAGLPVPDRSVGDKTAMLKNCERFVNGMCSGGKWKSYAELEQLLYRCREQLDFVPEHMKDVTLVAEVDKVIAKEYR